MAGRGEKFKADTVPVHRLVRVLIVEDSEEDAALLVRELKGGGYAPIYQRIETGEAMLSALGEQTWDLILADYSLPRFNGLTAFNLMKERNIDLPFILVSGTITEAMAVAAMNVGVHDYLKKGDLVRLTAAVGRELHEADVRRSRRLAETALVESEERFRLLVEGIQDYAIFMLNADGIVASWNAGAKRIFGYSSHDILGRHFSILYPTERVKEGKPEQQLKAALAAGRSSDESERVRKNGSRFWASVTTTALKDAKGTLRGFARVTHDITERRRMEQELLAISEREQKRIGQDLHDGLCSHLAGIVFQGEFLYQKLTEQSIAEAAIAGRMTEMIRQAITQAHGLARGLNPVSLETNGLATALQELAEGTEELYGIPCRFHCVAPVPVRDNVVATHLFRIAQEAVSNALKHGKPKRVVIELEASDSRTCLRVRDDGRGISGNGSSKGRLGLGITRYRAGLIGAMIDLAAGTEGGTVLTCLLGS